MTRKFSQLASRHSEQLYIAAIGAIFTLFGICLRQWAYKPAVDGFAVALVGVIFAALLYRMFKSIGV